MVQRKKSSHLTTGERGELAAQWFLRLHGYRILDRNYLCPMGEIDIVALKNNITVFVEVRTRQEGSLVDPVQSVTDVKLAKLMDAARYYLTARRRENTLCRFDIISVRPGGQLRGRIRHFKNAFWITDERPSHGAHLKAWIRRQPRFR